MARSTEKYVSSHETRDDARDAQRRLAAVLVAQGLTPTHTIGIRQKRGAWWCVLCVKAS